MAGRRSGYGEYTTPSQKFALRNNHGNCIHHRYPLELWRSINTLAFSSIRRNMRLHFTPALILALALTGCASPVMQKVVEDQRRLADYFSNPAVGDKVHARAVAQLSDVPSSGVNAAQAGKTFVPAQRTKMVPPRFPIERARAIGLVQGGVWVAFFVDEGGKVADARTVPDEGASSDPALIESALEAVKQWEFRPATLDGQPVRSFITTSILFQGS